MDWYEKNIEAGIKPIVKLLRDNGINTTYSCHHAMTIEAENYEVEGIQTVYDLLIENKYDGFTITMVFIKEQDQMLRRHLRIQFMEEG